MFLLLMHLGFFSTVSLGSEGGVIVLCLPLLTPMVTPGLGRLGGNPARKGQISEVGCPCKFWERHHQVSPWEKMTSPCCREEL